MKKHRQPYVAPRRIGEPEPGPSRPAFADQLEQLDRAMNVREWDWTADELAQALEDATVHLFCAPEDLERVRAWVALQPSADLYRVRSSPFVPPRTAYGFQLDGVHAPRSLSCVMRA